MLRRALFLLAFVLVAAGASAQTAAPTASVQGRVVDAETGEALPGVSVYLSRTTLGAATDADGRFWIRNVPAGAYEIVASMVGYGRVRRNVTAERVPVEESFVLRPARANVGEAVVVAGDDREWRRGLVKFELLFLGSTPRGRASTLLNPAVLDFAQTNGVFTASASAPLEFENRALGYRVTVALDRFQAVGSAIEFGGTTRYEPMTPTSPRQRNAWERERREAYRGSLQHFLRAVARGTAETEGFEGYLLDKLQVPRMGGGGPAFVPRVAFDSLLVRKHAAEDRAASDLFGQLPEESSDVHTFAFDRLLHVEYSRELEHRDSPQSLGSLVSRHQHSVLRLRGREAPFHSLGYFLNPYSAEVFGYWSWEGHAGDLLPLDYDPDGARPEAEDSSGGSR